VDSKEPVRFDLETVALLREILDEAGVSLPLRQRATTSRTLLAEAILKAAAKGKRDLERLVDTALSAVAVAA
jgi:hypothetical protein